MMKSKWTAAEGDFFLFQAFILRFRPDMIIVGQDLWNWLWERVHPMARLTYEGEDYILMHGAKVFLEKGE